MIQIIYNRYVFTITAACNNNKVVDYLVKNVTDEPFARNKSGETALNVCQRVGNDDGAKLLKEFQADYDKSADIADALLNELEAED